MRLVLDAETCTGHGRCYALAPELFTANDDDGHGELVGDGLVPSGAEVEAKRAALNCPERAITILDD
jgi:ferredoxin